jgi:DNA polymerase/3'-5' exonuclease PolX
MSGKLGGLRVTRKEAEGIALRVMCSLEIPEEEWTICGSYRRGKEDCGDVDIAVRCVKDNYQMYKLRLAAIQGHIKDNLCEPKKTFLFDGAIVEMHFALPDEWGAMLLHCTGSWQFNQAMRIRAIQFNMMLNQYGLWNRKTSQWVAGFEEEDIFTALGMSFIHPAGRNY